MFCVLDDLNHNFLLVFDFQIKETKKMTDLQNYIYGERRTHEQNVVCIV